MPARFTDDHRIILDHDIDVTTDYYFPANYLQVQQLLGKMLTHVDALGLSDVQQKAAKDLVRQSISAWWDGVQENSTTSYKGCIGPIEVQRAANRTEKSYVWVAQADLGDHSGPARVQVS